MRIVQHCQRHTGSESSICLPRCFCICLLEQLKQTINVRNSTFSPTSKNAVVKQLPGCRPLLELGLKAFTNAFLSTKFTNSNNTNNLKRHFHLPGLQQSSLQSISQCRESQLNIAKGTTDPRVEFISQALTQILIKFHFRNLD